MLLKKKKKKLIPRALVFPYSLIVSVCIDISLKNCRDVLCDFMYLTDLCSSNVVQIQCCSHIVLTLWCQLLHVPYSMMLTAQNIISYLLLCSPHGNSSLLHIITQTEFWSQRIKNKSKL